MSVLAPRRTVDWAPVREAFINRTPIPTYTELSAEFGMSGAVIGRCANEENWAEIRARRVELKLKESGAADMLLSALSDEGELTQRARRFVADFIGVGELLRQKIMDEEDAKTSYRVQSLNNLGFAFANIGRFVESMSSMSISGKLGKAQKNGSEQGQPWEKGMLQQINVTVQNLQSEAKQAGASKAQPVKDEDMG